MEEQNKQITIGEIVSAKGTARTRKLNEFLKTCTERQRAFLLFYGYSPMIVPEECLLPEKWRNKIVKSVKDAKEFYKWDSLGDTMRDLYLKLYITREGAGKALSYISAYVAKIDAAIAMANTINKALAYIPEEDRLDAYCDMQDDFNRTSTLAIEGDTAEIGIIYNSSRKIAEADTTDTDRIIKVAVGQYLDVIGDIKTFEVVFDELAETIGEDAYWIYPDRLDSLLWVFRKEDTFTIAYKDRLPNVDIDIPMLKDAPIIQYTYDYLHNELKEWI